MPAAPAPAQDSGGERVTARWSGSVNTSSRAATNSAYWHSYAENLDVPTGWLGTLLGCLLGLPSTRSNLATRNSLNFVRSLAGLAPVNFSDAMNRRAQSAALMMAANNSLNHNPPQSWRCYSPTGARTAGESNLALSFPQITSGQVVKLYMDDKGANNTAVGHRRWLLHPFTTTMGNGSTQTSNALTVIGPTASNRPNPSYVSWPSPGYFPRPLEPAGRWSLSAGLASTSFSKAQVRVFHNGHPVPVRKYPVHRGYAMPTVVWTMPAQPARVGRFQVRVTGIQRAGYQRTFSHSYTVRIFTPNR